MKSYFYKFKRKKFLTVIYFFSSCGSDQSIKIMLLHFLLNLSLLFPFVQSTLQVDNSSFERRISKWNFPLWSSKYLSKSHLLCLGLYGALRKLLRLSLKLWNSLNSLGAWLFYVMHQRKRKLLKNVSSLIIRGHFSE